MDDSDVGIPVIQVTEEPIVEKKVDKSEVSESENVLQMIIEQQKSRRKKFVFRDKQEGQESEDAGMGRSFSTECELSSTSSTVDNSLSEPVSGDGSKETKISASST